jgi:hypothetical protein
MKGVNMTTAMNFVVIFKKKKIENQPSRTARQIWQQRIVSHP